MRRKSRLGGQKLATARETCHLISHRKPRPSACTSLRAQRAAQRTLAHFAPPFSDAPLHISTTRHARVLPVVVPYPAAPACRPDQRICRRVFGDLTLRVASLPPLLVRRTRVSPARPPAMTLAAAHATLVALVKPALPRGGHTAALPPRSRGCDSGNCRVSRVVTSARATTRPPGLRLRAMEDSASAGGATDIVIPDTFRPPNREPRGGERHYFPPVGVADDPTLANPLQRQKRLSTEWFGCVFDLEGVLVKAREAEHRASWMRLAKEREEPPLNEMVLKFATTVKPEVFVGQHLRWTRDPMEMRRIVARRGEIYEEIMVEMETKATELGAPLPLREELLPGVLPFLELMKQNAVPMTATCGTKTFAQLCASLERLDVLKYFANEMNPGGEPNVVSSEDVSDWLPDPLPIERASQLMGRTPKRCVVFGDNNTITEAATECGAKSVLLLGRQPRYELQGADSVINSLADVTVSNLKNLFANETSEAAEPERQVEIMPQKSASTRTMLKEYDYDSQTQSDDAGGKEPPSYRSRRRRRDI